MKRALLLLALFGCGTQRPAVRPSPDDELYFCRYKKNPIRPPEGSLSLTPGGPVIARYTEKQVKDVGLELTVPWGAAGQPLRAHFTTGWVTYRTYLQATRPLVVYPMVPQRLGVLELGPYAPLEFLGTEGAGMRAGVTAPKGFRSTRPLELSLTCPDTAITSSGRGYDDDDDDAAARPDAGSPARVLLPDGQDIPVSMTPGGSVDGVLHFAGGALKRETTAPVLAEQGDAVKIRVHLWPGRVTGWVPRAATKPIDPRDTMGGLLGGLGLGRGSGAGQPAYARCGTGVPLYLLRDGRLEPAGELRSNAAYEVVKEESDWTEITLPENAWLKLEPGLSWALAPGDLAVCRTKPEKK